MTESTEDTVVWEPVSNGGGYNDYELAFVNVDKETNEVTLNVDGEDIEIEDTEGPMIQGEFQGIKDISAEDNPEPSIKVLIESESDERTYALNKVSALESKLEEVEVGDVVGLDFNGYVEPEDGLPWQNWKVLKPRS